MGFMCWGSLTSLSPKVYCDSKKVPSFQPVQSFICEWRNGFGTGCDFLHDF